MVKTDICIGCGKLIDKNYFYCPWCGVSRTNHENESSMELRYKQYKKRQMEERRLQLEKMSEELDNLEKELSVLVLSAEMHK